MTASKMNVGSIAVEMTVVSDEDSYFIVMTNMSLNVLMILSLSNYKISNITYLPTYKIDFHGKKLGIPKSISVASDRIGKNKC